MKKPSRGLTGERLKAMKKTRELLLARNFVRQFSPSKALKEELAFAGITHWEDRAPQAAPLPGPAPSMFFAPARIEQRRADWSPGGLEERLASAWGSFLTFVDGQVRIEHHEGADAVVEVFAELVENRTSPDVTHVLHP